MPLYKWMINKKLSLTSLKKSFSTYQAVVLSIVAVLVVSCLIIFTQIDDFALCVAGGGNMKRVGDRGIFQCVHTYSDAGKACLSSNECLGDCIVSTANSFQGVCKSDDNPFGCFTTVEKGGPLVCRD